jgi:hypothetical protein
MLKERVTIDAVSKLGSALEADLKNLLEYYGETPDSPDSPKPEDFFALILSFSLSLQVTCPSFIFLARWPRALFRRKQL